MNSKNDDKICKEKVDKRMTYLQHGHLIYILIYIVYTTNPSQGKTCFFFQYASQ